MDAAPATLMSMNAAPRIQSSLAPFQGAPLCGTCLPRVETWVETLG